MGVSGFIPFVSFFEGEGFRFLKYFDDYYNFVDCSPSSTTLFPLLNATHWKEDVLGVQGLNVYEPIGQVFKAASVDLVGLESHGLHLVSLGMHTVNAFMLSYWLSLLLKDKVGGRSAAMLVAFLWWLHPLNGEIVGWLSAQNYLFSMAFSLALMIRIEKTLSAVSLIGALAVVTLFLLAAFSKASAMTIVPFAIARLVHIHFYSDSGKKGRPKRYMVGLLIGLLVLADFGVVYSVHLSNRDSEQGYPEATIINLAIGGVMRSAMTVVQFLRRVFIPSDLSAHYQFARFGELQSVYYTTLPGVDVHPLAVMSVALLLATSAFLLARLRRDPLSAYAWVSFLLCWAPTSGILQHGDGSQFGANRYMYFPMVFGIAPLCVTVFQKVWQKGSSSSWGLCAAVVIVSLGYSYVGNSALATWKNDKALLKNCLKMDATDLVCLRYSAEYVGNYENNHGLATQYRKREYELVTSSVHGVSFNDLLYLGHLHLIFQEGGAACDKFKQVYSRGMPTGPRNQALNNYMMAKVNVILCLVQGDHLEAAGREIETIDDEEIERLRPRIKRSARNTLTSMRAFLDPSSSTFKEPFYSEFLH